MGKRRAGVGLLLALALGGSGCGKPSCRTQLIPQTPGLFRPPGRVNVEYTIFLQDGAKSTNCGGEPTTTFAQTVSVSLVAPDNTPVPVISPPQPLNPNLLLPFIFSPSVPGSYHFTARFEPDFGTVQTDVFIAVDRPDAVVKTIDVPQECARFDRLGEVTLCIQPEPDAGQLFTVVNGQVVTALPAFDFAAAPALGGVWAVAPGDDHSDRVQFHRLTDAGVLTLVGEVVVEDAAPVLPCQTAPCPPAYTIADARLMARGESALLLLPPVWGFASLDGGTIAFEAHLDTSDQMPIHPYAQWNGGEAVEVLGDTLIQGIRACTLPLDGGFSGCTGPVGIPIGATAGGVWLFDRFVTLNVDGVSLAPNGGTTSTTLLISEPDAPSTWPTPDATPRWKLDPGVVVLGSDGGVNSLEFFSLERGDATWFDADERHVWKWTRSTNKLDYIDR